MPTYLNVADLAYGTPDGRPLIQNLSFSLAKSEILLVKGRNGVGKTTLLEILSGALPAPRGDIQWKVERSDIFYLPQLHNREFHINLRLSDILSFSGKRRDEDLAGALEGLLTPSQLGLSWNTASGGERQKTLLIRAFLKNPKVLILDEPMNHLDIHSRKIVEDILRRYIEKEGRSVVMVGHHGSSAWNGIRSLDLSESMA